MVLQEKPLFRHMHHHKHPTEIKVTALQRLVLFLISCGLVSISVVWNNYFTVFTGWSIGFCLLIFQSLDAASKLVKKIWPHLHRFHIHHHCRYPNKCFGFTTIFWDVVFKTAPPKNARSPNELFNSITVITMKKHVNE
jgi:dihydroceramide fatty acyl 2-hydroxylase